jgi:hypothetical protein
MDDEKKILTFLAIESSSEVLAVIDHLQEKLKMEIRGSIS